MPFLPISAQEMRARGWEQADFVLVSGDAYVDHPSFGAAIISRLLESLGFRVAVLPQPDWRSCADFRRFGRPRLAFLVTAGNVDSMVAHYTAARRLRSDDAFTPGGCAGKRPDRAATVYARLCREAYADVPVILGGLEASLRRFAHYDYWSDRVMPSVLAESGADLLTFGMGERQTAQIARRLDAGEPVEALRDIRGVCWLAGEGDPLPPGHVACAGYEKVCEDKTAYARAAKIQLEEQDAVYGRAVVQRHGNRTLVQNPPALPLESRELDAVAELPYERYYHPAYEKLGGVPAIREVEFSITHNRGCFGGCNFCSIAFHQGRYVTARSHESVLREAQAMIGNPRFRGYISDLGGPTANFRAPACEKQREKGVCKGKKCLFPAPCPALRADHSDYLRLLTELRELPGVKKVFVRSGIRYDYLMADRCGGERFLRELAAHHVSGQLRAAPEHVSPPVLRAMGKPPVRVYERFCKAFAAATKKAGKEQYVLPYLMSSHPGSRLSDAVELAVWLKRQNIRPEQVQDFYPTPGTASTCMFYTGLDPYTMEPVYVPRTAREKKLQRALLMYYVPENRALVLEALKKAGREDLIGYGGDCLVRPEPGRPRPDAPWGDAQGRAAARGKKPQAPGAAAGRRSQTASPGAKEAGRERTGGRPLRAASGKRPAGPAAGSKGRNGTASKSYKNGGR